MAKIFITGSADGLGLLSAQALIKQGHEVFLHARNEQRAQQAMVAAPGAAGFFTGDLSDMQAIKSLAAQLNISGRFDVIIHNAGVYQAPGELLLAVNTVAPYILTCLVEKPARLIYLSSGMHRQGKTNFDQLTATSPTYSDTKLHDLLLSMAVARRWPDTISNAVDPGWVPTRMGGKGAPGNLELGYQTQVWLAVSNDPKALVSGRYFHHQREDHYLASAKDPVIQEQFLSFCEQLTGVSFADNDLKERK